MAINRDSDRLRDFLQAKIDKRKKQIHPAHNPRFNHDLQLEIDCIEWALKKIEVNKILNDRLEAVIRAMIKDLDTKMPKPPAEVAKYHINKKLRGISYCSTVF